jgi:adenylate kinase
LEPGEFPLIVLLFGPPGCGKGTQAAFIARRYPVPAISTGEIFRAECKASTLLGKQACSIMAQGGLVGDDIVNQMVANRIGQPDCRSGFLLDGYPRTASQAEFLDNLLREQGLPAPTVIHLEVPAGKLVRRLAARRQCPQCSKIYNLVSQPPQVAGICDADGTPLTGRSDDTEAVIHERLKAYEELTGPVIAHYRYASDASYHKLNGDRPAEEVQRDIARLLAPGRRVRTAAYRGVAALAAG